MARVQPILVRVLAALLIGAVMTVGVAVGCAMCSLARVGATARAVDWLDEHTNEMFRWRAFDEAWGSRMGMFIPLEGWPSSPYTLLQDRKRPDPILESRPIPRVVMRMVPRGRARIVRLAGWPAECVWAGVERDPPSYGLTLSLTAVAPAVPDLIGAKPIGRPYSENDHRGLYGYLPAAPIWSGLALDTVFYAAIAWGLLFLSAALRRGRRRRAVRCVTCGYDRAGIAAGAICPECGGMTPG